MVSSISSEAGETKRYRAIGFGVVSVVAMATGLAVTAFADLALIPALFVLFPGVLLLIVARQAGGYGLSAVGHTPTWWNAVVVLGALACVPLQSAMRSSILIAAWALLAGVVLVVPELVGYRRKAHSRGHTGREGRTS